MEKAPLIVRPSVRSHKNQYLWQILVPFLVLAGIIITGAVLVVTSGQAQNRAWADISVIWLLVPMLVFAMVALTLMVTIIYGMAKLLQLIPDYASKAQGLFVSISTRVRTLADGSTKPILWLREARAIFKSIFKI